MVDRVVGVLVPPVRWHVFAWLVSLLWGESGGVSSSTNWVKVGPTLKLADSTLLKYGERYRLTGL